MKLTLNLSFTHLGKLNGHDQIRSVVFNGTHFIIDDTVYYLNLEQREALLNHLASTFTEKKSGWDSEGCYYERS